MLCHFFAVQLYNYRVCPQGVCSINSSLLMMWVSVYNYGRFVFSFISFFHMAHAKVHIDQNEKLAMFGVTHVCAVDGYSGKIVGFATMARKNNALIYEHLYR